MAGGGVCAWCAGRSVVAGSGAATVVGAGGGATVVVGGGVVGGIHSGVGGAPYGCMIVVAGGGSVAPPHPVIAAATAVVRNAKSAARPSRAANGVVDRSPGPAAPQNGQCTSLART